MIPKPGTCSLTLILPLNCFRSPQGAEIDDENDHSRKGVVIDEPPAVGNLHAFRSVPGLLQNNRRKNCAKSNLHCNGLDPTVDRH